MNYIFNYCLPIYNKDEELVVCIEENSMFSLLESAIYNQSEFMGYNLLIVKDGNFILLETYEYEEECTYARLEIEKALDENRAKVYL